MRTIDDCVEAALATLTPETLARFPADPLQTMRNDLGLKVHQAEHLTERRADGGACDGLSFLKDGVVLYARTPNSRRENFTLAHEVGHGLINQVPEIFDWLFEQRESKRMLETLCDRIAQRLLLAEPAITAVMGAGPLRAHHVIDLYESTQASLPVCAIALAARLPMVGAVVIADRPYQSEVVVRYASVHPDPERGWPKVYPWPGQAVPTAHPLRFLTRSPREPRQTFWATPWNGKVDFYMDAVAVNSTRSVAVLAEVDLWGAESFHPQMHRDYDERPQQDITCCGQIRSVRGFPCQTCGQVHCPVCGKCRCDRRNDELVACAGNCFLPFRPNLLVNRLCEDCR